MKIVFMGTPQFAVPSLQALIDAGYEIQLVVTQPDKRGNRGKMTVSPVKDLAMANNLAVAQPIKIRRDEEFIESLRKLEPDLVVVAAFGQILPESLLEIPRLGCINVHGSLLPHLRGASPMQAAILNGDKETGVTIMRMEAGLDTGDMISKVAVAVGDKNITELAEEMAVAGAKLLVDTIPSIADGTAVYEKQDDEKSTYAKMINKTDGMTDFNEAADVIERKIRAYYEWPNVYSYLGNDIVKFYGADVVDEKPDGPAGTISTIGKNDFVINCAQGKLRVKELQLQGKKRMSAGDFLRGRKLSVGDRFTIS